MSAKAESEQLQRVLWMMVANKAIKMADMKLEAEGRELSEKGLQYRACLQEFVQSGHLALAEIDDEFAQGRGSPTMFRLLLALRRCLLDIDSGTKKQDKK